MHTSKGLLMYVKASSKENTVLSPGRLGAEFSVLNWHEMASINLRVRELHVGHRWTPSGGENAIMWRIGFCWQRAVA